MGFGLSAPELSNYEWKKRFQAQHTKESTGIAFIPIYFRVKVKKKKSPFELPSMRCSRLSDPWLGFHSEDTILGPWRHLMLKLMGQTDPGHMSKPRPDYRATQCPPAAPSHTFTPQRAPGLPWTQGWSRSIPRTRAHLKYLKSPREGYKHCHLPHLPGLPYSSPVLRAWRSRSKVPACTGGLCLAHYCLGCCSDRWDMIVWKGKRKEDEFQNHTALGSSFSYFMFLTSYYPL